MPLDFPASPTNGQAYESYVYDSATSAWRSKGGAVAATYVSDTAPSGAVKGDMWYRSSDGTTYVYVVDADTSQWVEIRSEIAFSKVGLVPIVPTSVTLSSGTASVAANGAVTISSSGDAVINGIFSSAYRNYRIIFNGALTGNGAWGSIFAMRFSSGGTTNSSSNYTYTAWYSQSGTNGNQNGTGTLTNWMWSVYAKDLILEVYSPADASTGTQMGVQGFYNNTAMFGQAGYNGNTAFDGIQFANNFYSGTVKVYGYN